jgi:LPS sulfotransferase NodH
MTNYRKFLLLTSPRSGTHMLKSSLDSHPNIVCLTEMFNPDYIEEKYPYDDSMPAQKVLDEFIYCDYNPEIKAVGFCLHRIGARFGNWPNLWQILAEMPDLYVISLSRENLLRRYLSVQLQQIRNLEEAELKPITFDPEKLMQDFQKQRKKIKDINEFLSHHPIINVTYEQLCKSYPATMKKLQDFLGVPAIDIQPNTAKRNNPPITNFILNYQELKQSFSTTEWSYFFDV